METLKLSLKFWVGGKRPDKEKGIEVSESFLEERCRFLDCKYQNQPTSKDKFFTKYALKGGLKLVIPSLSADERPNYLIEIIGTEEGIFELTGKCDLPYSRLELETFRE